METDRVLEAVGVRPAGRTVLLVGKGARPYGDALQRMGAHVAILGDAAVRYLRPGGAQLHAWLVSGASTPSSAIAKDDGDVDFDIVIWVPGPAGTVGFPEAAGKLANLARDRLIVLADADEGGWARGWHHRAGSSTGLRRWVPGASWRRWRDYLSVGLKPDPIAPTDLFGESARRFHGLQVKCWDAQDRAVIECRRPRIDDLVVVSGCNTSGKSTLCRALAGNAYEDEIGVDLSDAIRIGSQTARKRPYEALFPQRDVPSVLLHHDLSSLTRYVLPSYPEDPAGELLRCARIVHVILVVLPVEVLTEQMLASELSASKQDRKPFHRLELQRFHEAGYLLGMYQDWVRFCMDTTPGRLRLYVYGLQGRKRVLRRLESPRDAVGLIRGQYSNVPLPPPIVEKLSAKPAVSGRRVGRSKVRWILSKLRRGVRT